MQGVRDDLLVQFGNDAFPGSGRSPNPFSATPEEAILYDIETALGDPLEHTAGDGPTPGE